jgi:hypothetical protein
VSDGGERLFFGVDYGSAKPAVVVIFVRRSGRVESCPVTQLHQLPEDSPLLHAARALGLAPEAEPPRFVPTIIPAALPPREPPRSELPPWRGESWRRDRRRR